MQNIAPERHAMMHEYDNVGLMIGDENAHVDKVLVCLDCTDAVLDEAIEKKAQLIVSHHPFIYAPIKNITASKNGGRNIMKAIKNDIAIYSSHTNLDFVINGINDFIAQKLSLHNVTVLEPYISEFQGLGRVGTLPKHIGVNDFKQKVATMLDDDKVSIISKNNSDIKRVAIINGAGGGDTKYIDLAVCHGATCLVTAEVKHHVALYAYENDFTILECQHYTMERFFIPNLVRMLTRGDKNMDLGVEFLVSESDINVKK